MTTEKETYNSEYMVISALTRLNGAFTGSRTKALLSIYKEKLGYLRASNEDIRDAIERCIDSEERFPSIHTIKAYLPNRDKDSETDISGMTQKERTLYVNEQKKLQDLKGIFIGREKDLEKVVEHWCRVSMGPNFLNLLKEANYTVAMFEKPALFDLIQNAKGSKESLEKLIVLNNEKAERYRAQKYKFYYGGNQ